MTVRRCTKPMPLQLHLPNGRAQLSGEGGQAHAVEELKVHNIVGGGADKHPGNVISNGLTGRIGWCGNQCCGMHGMISMKCSLGRGEGHLATRTK